jgi:hypothetical protein
MHNFVSSLNSIKHHLSAFDYHFYINGIHLHYGSNSFLYSSILIIIDIVMDIILVGEEGTKGGKTKFGKTWA